MARILGLNVEKVSYGQTKTALTRETFKLLKAAGARWVQVGCFTAYI